MERNGSLVRGKLAPFSGCVKTRAGNIVDVAYVFLLGSRSHDGAILAEFVLSESSVQ